MNYEKLYNNLVDNALSRETTDGYTENHHIRPRCIGGKDVKSNMVTFTAREHFIAHWLLTKVFMNTRHYINMLRAFTAMNMVGNGQDRSITARQFQSMREAYVEAFTGINNPMHGKDPHNLGKIVWYIPRKDTHVFSNEKPEHGARKGRRVSEGVKLLQGTNNGMSGVSIYGTLSKDKLERMLEKRGDTYYSKTEEERRVINLARTFGYQFTIDGKYYPTLNSALVALDLSHKVISKRCKSDLFPEWIRSPRDHKYKK